MPRFNSKETGDYIKIMIKLCGLTPREIAEATGFTLTYLSQCAAGRGDPRDLVDYLREQYAALQMDETADPNLENWGKIINARSYLETGKGKHIGGVL